jgi:hypothetical protein
MLTGEHPFAETAEEAAAGAAAAAAAAAASGAAAAATPLASSTRRLFRRIVDPAVPLSPALLARVSPAAADLLRALLERDPAQRAGTWARGGLAALRSHPFFRVAEGSPDAASLHIGSDLNGAGASQPAALDWTRLRRRGYPAGWRPPHPVWALPDASPLSDAEAHAGEAHASPTARASSSGAAPVGGEGGASPPPLASARGAPGSVGEALRAAAPRSDLASTGSFSGFSY